MILGIPRFGIYSSLIKSNLERLGVKVVMPPKITREMIEAGVANSSCMICYPYKVTLGQFVWCLDNGATDLIMWDNAGLCRQRHYYQLQELALRQLGYKFTMHSLSAKNARKKAKELLGLSAIGLRKLGKQVWDELHLVEARAFGTHGKAIKVGIVGEIYTILESEINFDIIRRLQRMGVDVDVSVKITDFIRHNWLKKEERLEEQDEARKLLSAEIGGHGFHSIYNTIWYGKHGYDGVIHITPLTCLPETTVESIVDYVAEKYNLPLYRFPIDEGCFEKGFLTRLETFVSMLQRRKRCISG